MKKVLISVMAIALVAALVGAGAFAYFTDTETSSANAFQAGRVALELNQLAPFNIGNIYPGWSDSTTVTLTNTGTLPVKFMGTCDVISDPNGLADMLDVVVRCTAIKDEDENTPSGIYPPPYDLPYSGSLADLETAGFGAWDSTSMGDVQFGPGWTYELEITITFNVSADNEYQGTSCSGTVAFTATTWNNPGWAQ